MSIETSVLTLMKSRIGFNNLYNKLPTKSLTAQTLTIVDDIKHYFDQFPEATEINFPEFKHLFFLVRHKSLDENQKDYYNILLNKIDSTKEFIDNNLMIKALGDMKIAEQLESALDSYNNDEEIDIESAVMQIVKDIETQKMLNSAEYEVDDFNDLMKSAEAGTGLKWRNPALDESLEELQFGDDFLVISARPNQGKTTFICNEITHMAGQVDDRPVLWLNNEGTRERIVKRNIQVALGATKSEMIQMNADGTLLANYEKAINAPADRIRVLNIHGFWNYQVEDLIKQHNPKIVVFDMIDHIKFKGISLEGGARTDQVLEEMYKWARELGVKYKLIPMATSQISVEGEGIPYPDKSMLKDSKCFAPGTLIRMYDGTKKAIEDIKIGDCVMGIDSTKRTVQATGAGIEPMFRVSTPSWSFDCNLSHNLVVRNTCEKNIAGLKKGEVRDLALTEWLDHPTYQTLTAVNTKIEYSEKELPIEPKLLGLWLGDGKSREYQITTTDKEIYDYICTFGTTNIYRQPCENWLVDVSLVGGRKVLKDSNLWQNKHIPQLYKTASIRQRKELLAGLMDSDGTVDSGNSVITMSRENLIDDIIEVARSLGYNTFKTTKTTNFKTQAYTATIANTDYLPVLLDRKRTICNSQGQRMKVEPLGTGTYYGITVDGDSRYCHADYVALRNTGKQGAADTMIMIGHSNDPAKLSSRYISTPKTKSRREGATLPRAEFIFDEDRARLVRATV